MLWGPLVWVWPSRGLSGWSPGLIDVGPPGLCGMRGARGPPSPALSVLGSEGVLGLTDLSCLRPNALQNANDFDSTKSSRGPDGAGPGPELRVEAGLTTNVEVGPEDCA